VTNDSVRQDSNRSHADRIPTARFIRLGFAVLLPSLAGCGTNADELLLQALNASGRTAVDQWLTSVANALAGTPNTNDDEPADGGDSSPGDGDSEPDGGTAGDPVAGSGIFAANNCGGCHCADATGGCALGAPAIIGATIDRLMATFAETSAHPVKPVLSEQGLADLAAFLDDPGSAGG